MIYKDQLNRKLQLKSLPKRIISLVPSQTELLCDLGLKNSIVGVTKFCVHPNGLIKDKEVVGGTKQIHLEKIKALQPDIILCNKEENTKDIVKACEAICPVHVSDIFTISDSIALIEQYGKMFSCEAVSKHLSVKITSQLKDFQEFIKNKPTLKVAYFIWKNPWMVAANNTFVNHLLQLNKFENVYANEKRYPEVDIENQSVTKQVELVLLSSEPYPFKEKHSDELAAHYPNAKVILVDGEYFSWYGSRLTKTFTYFKTLRLSF